LTAPREFDDERECSDEIVDYLVTLKRSEWTRFGAAVTDWEQREYYDTF